METPYKSATRFVPSRAMNAARRYADNAASAKLKNRGCITHSRKRR